jgi:hypothetical protein
MSRYSSSASSSGNNKGKLIFAIALLVVAGLVIAWSQGWIFGEKAPKTDPSKQAQMQQQFEVQQKAADTAVKQGKASVGGS